MKDKILDVLIGIFIAVSMYFIIWYLFSFYIVIINVWFILGATSVVEFVIYIVLEKLLNKYFNQEQKNIFIVSMSSAFLTIIVESVVIFLIDAIAGIFVLIEMGLVWFGIIILRLLLFLINSMKKSS